MHNRKRYSQGVFLAEFLIAMVLSMVVVAMIIKFLGANLSGETVASGYHDLRRDGNTALRVLGDALSTAGENNASSPGNGPLDPILTANGNHICNELAGTHGVELCSSQDNLKDHSDVLALHSRPMNNISCTGDILVDGTRIANLFYVDNAEDVLRCRYYNFDNQTLSGEVDLVSNVEQMQVEYILDTGEVVPDSDAVYVAGESVVAAVTVAFLVRGSEGSDPLANQKDYQLLDGAVVSHTDTIARQVFTSSFIIHSASNGVMNTLEMTPNSMVSDGSW